MIDAVRLPWLVSFGEAAPPELSGHQGSVVQAPRRSAVESLSTMRQQGFPVGAVLICLVHELAHVPIGPDEGPWQWPPPSALCRRRTTRCGSPDGGGLDYRPCAARFWLLPPEGGDLLTDGVALYDTLCRVRSLRRRGADRFAATLPTEAPHPEEFPPEAHPSPCAPQEPHPPQEAADLYYRWTS